MIEDLFGINIFHHRFQPDSGWNPPSLAFDRELQRVLEQSEVTFASDSNFMSRATQLLLAARARSARA